jgi:FAD/FMN-containing dehydrogenase
MATDTGVEQLRDSLKGELIQPGQERYEKVRRVWNGMIDRKPAMIVRCRGTADVIAAVKFARARGLPVSVRGGGHNVAGRALVDGGLVIDLSPMRSVRVDPKRKLVRVGGGSTLGDIDHETAPFGLAVPMGLVTRTGIAGLTLHGGIGQLTRKYGLAADNLMAADVVTADGRLLMADAEHHPDLLWALRGGGGNFGVVTSFEFQLRPISQEIWVAMAMYPVAKARKVLGFFRDFMMEAPDEIMSLALLWNSPTEEHIAPEHRGVPVVVLSAWYSGSFEEGENALRPFREVDTPIIDLSGPMPYLTSQALFDVDFPPGRRYYWKSLYLNDLSDEVIQALIDHAALRPSPISELDIWALGGAMSRVRPEDTAFGARDAPFMLGVEANWLKGSEDEANVAWARRVYHDLLKFSTGRSYLNFPGFAEEGEELIRKTYGANYPRLQAVKARYDPDNFFSSTLNISPKA